MSWALMGLAGALKDQTFPLKTDMTLGRQGDVVVTDSKASSIHARIQCQEDGSWILTDNNSKNGTRVNGDRISSVPLRLGTLFYIGDQGFEVIEIIDKQEAPQNDIAPFPAKSTKRYWYDILASFLRQNSDQLKDKMHPVSPLEPALVLEFVRGIQTNSHWILGYGPRKVGRTSMDLPIWEPGAPAICFEISPTHKGVLFKTAHPEIVQLNGEAVDSRVLRVGDTIRIQETLIEVDFSE